MKFKVGEIYKDRDGMEYRFIAYVPEAMESVQLIFMGLETLDIKGRYSSGARYDNRENSYDILPPEKKTVKLYPALCRSMNNPTYFVTADLYETKPERAIRLLTEWPAVVVEVEE